MFCPNCGKELPEGSKFCDNCGTQIGGQQESSTYEPPYQDEIRELESNLGPRRKKSGGGPGKIIAIGLVVAALIGVAAISISVLNKIVKKPGTGSSTAATTSTTNTTGTSTTTGTTNTAGTTATTGSAESTQEWNEKWLLGDDVTESGWYAEGRESGDYSTDALPGEDDFLWFYNHEENTVNAGIPEGAALITDAEQLAGGWKCLVVRRPTTEPIREYWNIDLTMNGSAVACMQHWSGRVEYGGEFEATPNANSNPLSGVIYDDGVMDLEDSYGSTFSIIQWYSYNGKQYGIGTYECGWDEEDKMGLAAVCRP